jgi:hypothetical protein
LKGFESTQFLFQISSAREHNREGKSEVTSTDYNYRVETHLASEMLKCVGLWLFVLTLKVGGLEGISGVSIESK